MAIPVKLQAFEGPLDLLLHLIDINKIDIYDIPIVTITDQYLEYVRDMGEADMNVTSEFMVMAATLLDIKCKMLLPPEKDEEGNDVDPRDELVEKLLEYKTYKYMSYALSEREKDASFNYYRERRLPKEVQEFVPPIDYDELIGTKTLLTLQNIYQDVLQRADYRVDPIRSKFGNIEKEAIDMGSKVLFVKAYLIHNPKTDFRSLLEEQKSKEEIIVTFLIMLELMKTGVIHIEQDETFGRINVSVIDTEKLKNMSIGEFTGEAERDEEQSTQETQDTLLDNGGTDGT